MRKQTVENQYRTTYYKIKQYFNKGLPNLTEAEYKEYNALVVLADVLKAEMDKSKPKTAPKPRKSKKGIRLGVGAKINDPELKKQNFSVSLFPAVHRKFVAKYGSLTKAIETILEENEA